LDSGFEAYHERHPPGLIRRFLETFGQLLGILFGGMGAYIDEMKSQGKAGYFGVFLLRVIYLFAYPILDKNIINRPFPIQFRRRLEKLGPTYIKLGQILCLREDLLPKSVTDELKRLLDKLPAVSYERFKDLITESLEQPLYTMFVWIDPVPLGSASLAQTHRARLITHERVVIKVLKPGVREIVHTDTRLLRFFSRILQVFLARYQPARVIGEFCSYTLREVDLRMEADNADTFAAYFKDDPRIRFPKVYRQYSNRDVLTMQYFKGIKPDGHAAQVLTPAEKANVIDLGIGAIIRMIYRDGFFHADLHPANLMIFRDGTVGFIDLGMVGKFDRDTRKRLFYYFYSLVAGDPESAARYLASLAKTTRNTDLDGFRRAVSDLYARWLRTPNFKDFSLAQVILESMLLAGHYYVQYPGEIILMVKALVTIEGVGNLLQPGINVTEVARKHVRTLLLSQFNPLSIMKESALIIPEMVDVINKSPLILAEGLKALEANIKKPQQGPLNGVRATILAGFFILAGAILAGSGGPWYIWGALFLIGFILAVRS
jgi:ubiquinone biosynthesis protein